MFLVQIDFIFSILSNNNGEISDANPIFLFVYSQRYSGRTPYGCELLLNY